MVPLTALWPPILLSAIIVFVASSVMHMLLTYRVTGTAAFLAYGLGHLSDGIWKGQTWGATLKEVIDGLVYGLLTAGTFGWLWPR